ncbi:polysaccharide deacetylase family protein [uncultured Methanofollis sp.]|uniref:polysaccharide deacetylase family protein n=1 Tax=uncultured Methanofollis sp. TaxID=262500 RepID=UPI002630D25B|nr:polysaccharide deacetylase family protein [uncultured Methanofollis sp.]
MLGTLREDPDVWALFTRSEEYAPGFHDRYDRFPFYLSKNRNVFEPVASQYLFERGFCPEYPEDRDFALCLTHDIDSVYSSLMSKGLKAFNALRSGCLSDAKRSLMQMKTKRSPWCNFQDIIAMEQDYGATSTFFFLVLDSASEDYAYDIEDLEPDLGMIVDEGYEIGLHGGHQTYNNPDEIRENKRKLDKLLNKPVVGYRNHYLKIKVPETWEYLSKAGFQYDSTMGFADCAGFRNGMCYPYRPFDLRNNRVMNIVEIPLAIMDKTLFFYMHLDLELSWKLICQIIENVKQCNGVLNVLWHNNCMTGDYLVLYKKLLEYCSKEGAWMTSGKEIYDWWSRYL